MTNLKIKLNSKSEAEEVKRLAVKAGYKLDALFGRKWSNEFCYLVLCENMAAGFANEIMADGDKSLSMAELRAMVNPVKEYLVKNIHGEYVLVDHHSGFDVNELIEIPEGAEAFGYTGIVHTFYKDDFRSFFNENTDGQWDDRGETWIGRKDPVILWQRATHPEELPFIDDEPKYTDDEVKYMDENGQGRLQSLNDQYAEIEQVRQAIKVKSGSDSDHALDAMSFGLMGAGASQSSGGVDATLAERQSTYGNFEDVAFVTENIMSILAKVRVNGLDDLPNTHRMALYMIASKMARIVNGDFNHLDSWHDIGGYSKLIEKLIKGE